MVGKDRLLLGDWPSFFRNSLLNSQQVGLDKHAELNAIEWKKQSMTKVLSMTSYFRLV